MGTREKRKEKGYYLSVFWLSTPCWHRLALGKYDKALNRASHVISSLHVFPSRSTFHHGGGRLAQWRSSWPYSILYKLRYTATAESASMILALAQWH